MVRLTLDCLIFKTRSNADVFISHNSISMEDVEKNARTTLFAHVLSRDEEVRGRSASGCIRLCSSTERRDKLDQEPRGSSAQ